jgi:eukaryotic-like serine/threonine-protein kinase
MIGGFVTNSTVPDLTNMSQAEATVALQANGLVPGQVTQAYSDVAAGKIISQDPAKGTQQPKGTSIAFVLSKGLEPAEVPDVVGLQDTEAVSKLQAAGFIPVPGGSKFDAKAPLGQVLSQTPKALTQQPKGTQVTYITSKGQQMGVVPDVVRMSKADAIAALEKAKFKVSSSTDYSDTIDAGDVISQSPFPGGQYATGTTVKIVVSKGQRLVTVPNLNGMGRDAAITKIKSLGLKPNVLATGVLQPGSTTYSGTVIDQSPAKNKEVAPGSTVDITVDEATEPPTP